MIVYLNAQRLELPDGATAGDAVEALDPDLHRAVREGGAYLTDGTGQAVDPRQPVPPGAILRAARSARQR